MVTLYPHIRPGDEVKVVLRSVHRAGWVTVTGIRGDGLIVDTPDGLMEVEGREVAGWRPA